MGRDFSFSRGFLYMVAVQGVFLASAYVTHAGLARSLGPEKYGLFGLIVSLLAWVELVLNSGIPSAVQKHLPQDSRLLPVIKTKALVLQTLLAFSAFGFCLSLTPLLARLLQESALKIYLPVAFLDLLVYGYYVLYSAIQVGLKNFKSCALIAITYAVMKMVGILLPVLLWSSLMGALLGNMVASFIGFVLGMKLAKESSLSLSRKGISYNAGIEALSASLSLKALARFAFPVIIFSLEFNLLGNLDLFLIKGLLSDPHQPGYYVAALLLAKVPYHIFLALSAVLLPSLSASLYMGEEKLSQEYIQQSFRLILIVLVPCLFLVIPTSQDLISLIFTDAYSEAASVLKILMVGMLFSVFYFTLHTMLMAKNEPMLSFLITLLLIFVDLALNFVLIPLYGIQGAAWATTLTLALGASLLGVFVLRRFKVGVNLYSGMKIFLVCWVIYFLIQAFPLQDLFILIRYGIFYGAYLMLLYGVGEITPHDLQIFRGAPGIGSERNP